MSDIVTAFVDFIKKIVAFIQDFVQKIRDYNDGDLETTVAEEVSE